MLVLNWRSNGFDVIRQHFGESRRDGYRTLTSGSVLEFGPFVGTMTNGQSPVLDIDVGAGVTDDNFMLSIPTIDG
jgi:hypothetical protein